MVLFGSGGDVAGLIARKKYTKAIEALREQLEQESGNPRMRMQLADVLIMAGREREAVPVLIDLADDFASEGQAAKAIALLKKIERLDPGRPDVELKLAALIKQKTRPRPKPTGWTPREGIDKAGYEPAGVAFSEAHFAPKEVPSPEARIEAARASSWVPSTRQEESDAAEAYMPAVPPAAPTPSPESAPEDEADAAIAADLFRGQILDVIQETLHRPKAVIAAAPAGAAQSPAGEAEEVREVVETPLFSGFSQDELVAVIRGLRLLSFEPGDIILTEGDPGDSLFVLTTGVVKTFVRNPSGGRQLLVRELGEGEFFGEISILSGKPRSATVTAATRCELLELDRANLDAITSTYPHVRRVLEDFYIARASTQGEAMARAMEARGEAPPAR